ncbi:MAG: winged helix DNA-binding protein [Clostridia bacterium]|nr:winged helix DNA-binding protein [Clostridia bacterium]
MENKRLYGRICYLQRQMSRENNYMFSEYGITPIQMHVLIFVHKSVNEGKSVCQKDIEKYINLRASSVSSLVGTLEKTGLIMRTVSEGDARTKFVTLTEKGTDVCIKNKLLMEKCDALVQSALTDEEQEIFNSLLNKILAEIQKQEKEVKND